MKEIQVKFKSCLESDNLLTEKIILKNEAGEEIGWIKVAGLTDRQKLDLQQPDITKASGRMQREWVEEIVFQSIKEWGFRVTTTGIDGPLPLAIENLRKMELSIVDALFPIIMDLSTVKETDEKNSVSS